MPHSDLWVSCHKTAEKYKQFSTTTKCKHKQTKWCYTPCKCLSGLSSCWAPQACGSVCVYTHSANKPPNPSLTWNTRLINPALQCHSPKGSLLSTWMQERRVVEQFDQNLPDHVRKVHRFREAGDAEDTWGLLGKTKPIFIWRFWSQRLNRDIQIWRGIPASTCICDGKQWSIPTMSTTHVELFSAHLYLCNPSQLCAELRESWVLLRLNVRMKFRLNLPCLGVEQNSGEFN